MKRALILIDIQTGFDNPVWGARNNPGAEANAAQLLGFGRDQGWQICHVRHVSVEPGSPLAGAGTSFKPEVAPHPDEPVFEKSVNSAFIGTNLETHLRKADVRDVVICGLTTPHCVSTTTRMAANLGFNVQLVHDACASFEANGDASWMGKDAPPPTPDDIHRAALTHLHGEFAQVVSTHDVISCG